MYLLMDLMNFGNSLAESVRTRCINMRGEAQRVKLHTQTKKNTPTLCYGTQ